MDWASSQEAHCSCPPHRLVLDLPHQHFHPALNSPSLDTSHALTSWSIRHALPGGCQICLCWCWRLLTARLGCRSDINTASAAKAALQVCEAESMCHSASIGKLALPVLRTVKLLWTRNLMVPLFPSLPPPPSSIPLGLEPMCWAANVFPDQKWGLQGGKVHLGHTYCSLKHLSVTSCKRDWCCEKKHTGITQALMNLWASTLIWR